MAKKMMPAVLQRLMRHAGIQTTMNYYVATNAGDIAEGGWAAFGNTPGNNGRLATEKDSPQNAASPDVDRTSISGQGRG